MSIGTWRGRPLEDLTRDELLDVIATMGRMQDADRRRHAQELDFLRLVMRR